MPAECTSTSARSAAERSTGGDFFAVVGENPAVFGRCHAALPPSSRRGGGKPDVQRTRGERPGHSPVETPHRSCDLHGRPRDAEAFHAPTRLFAVLPKG